MLVCSCSTVSSLIDPTCLRADGKLNFRGLVASPDGKTVHETTRSGAWTEEDVLRLGREAGEELKVGFIVFKSSQMATPSPQSSP